MAEITKPIALDESFNTTEGSPRNLADVLAQGIGDLVTVVSRISHQTTYDELSDLEDVNISTPTNGDVLTYDGSKWVNGQGGGSSSCEELIAPVETSTTASQSYAIGEQFILNGTLYTATANISAGGTITINGNCTASDSVTEQIKEKYSTSETIVGEWIDGTPVYQKVVNFGALPNNTSKSVAHNITNMGYIISADAFMSKADYSAQYFIPVVNVSSLNGQVSLGITHTNIYITTKSDQSSYTICYVVMRYTKHA